MAAVKNRNNISGRATQGADKNTSRTFPWNVTGSALRSNAALMQSGSERAVEKSAVEQNALPGDVTGVLTAQEGASLAKLFRIAESTSRNLGRSLFRDFLFGHTG
jgi:hypothetical protein